MTAQRPQSRLGGQKAMPWWMWALTFIVIVLAIWIWNTVTWHRNQWRGSLAVTYCKQLEVATGQYQQLYGSLPWTAELGAGGDLLVDGDRYQQLILGLAAKDPVFNPRNKALVGLDTDGNYRDPWGHDLLIVLDLDQTNSITHPDVGTLKRTIIVWSPGPDGKWEPPVTDRTLSKNRDNIQTWPHAP